MKHRGWIVLSGIFWLLMGGMLLRKGLSFLVQGVLTPHSLCDRFQGIFGSPSQTGTALLVIALVIGFLKGRLVLSKTVAKMVQRILSLELPIRFVDVYPRSYWFLIGGMMSLGVILRFGFIPIDLRGMIDVAVGSALLNGSLLYFRAALVRPSQASS